MVMVLKYNLELLATAQLFMVVNQAADRTVTSMVNSMGRTVAVLHQGLSRIR